MNKSKKKSNSFEKFLNGLTRRTCSTGDKIVNMGFILINMARCIVLVICRYQKCKS